MIRIAQPADVLELLHIYAPYVAETTVSFEYEPPAPEVFRQRFDDITAQFPWLVWEENGSVLGYAYASAPFARAAYRWCAEPSIYLRPEARGRGIGRRLYEALETILILQGYRVSYAIITGENQASLAFHEKMGYKFLSRFESCGYKFSRWMDVIWMEKTLQAVGFPSSMPKAWPSIRYDAQRFLDNLENLSLS